LAAPPPSTGPIKDQQIYSGHLASFSVICITLKKQRNIAMKSSLKTVIIFLSGIAAGGSLIAAFAFDKGSDKQPLVEVAPDGRLQYKWYAPEVPHTANFAGEPAPLDRWEVRERLDRDMLTNYYTHGSLLYILKLTTRYFPIIEPRLKAAGVPDDFKYLCVSESSLQHLTSSAGAQSLWQFLGGTATQYGLQVDAEVDERYNVAKATDAACKYFNTAYAKFGSWTAAAASYNCGMGGYNNQATYQGSTNYYDLLLPEETNRYIFRILALKYLISNARNYGYIIESSDAYKPFRSRNVTIRESIPDLSAYARANGTSYKIVKILNPWLRSRSLTVKGGKSYELAMPL
jgi:hypothetical protein